MNDAERMLIQFICNRDTQSTREQAKIILNSISSKSDEQFKEKCLKKLNTQDGKFIELPYNMKDILTCENVEDFPEDRFYIRDSEKRIVDKIIKTRKVASILEEKKIAYHPAAILYGESGTGKTMLAKYIAYKMKLPFAYIKVSGIMDSMLGGTQTKLNKVFEYVRENQCLICFDEMDYLGMKRGQKDDVGEMNRIVISLMQELDITGNNCVIIGTTNRFDRLDPALVRRFPICEEIKKLDEDGIRELAGMFFDSTDTPINQNEFDELVQSAYPSATQNFVSELCTRYIVDKVSAESEGEHEQRD